MPPLIPVCHTRRRTSRRIFAAVFLSIALTLIPPSLFAQDARVPARSVSRTIPLPRGTITISGGMMMPMAHALMTDLWKPGPSVSLAAYRTVNRLVSLGFGFEAALFSFDDAGFALKYPAVAPHPLQVGYLHLHVGWRFQMRSGGGIIPTLGATIGASKMTRATHQERISGVRVTYYDIPGRFRLTGGLTAGLDFPLSRLVALSLEGRGLYLMNDPDASVLAGGRLGLRFTLE